MGGRFRAQTLDQKTRGFFVDEVHEASFMLHVSDDEAHPFTYVRPDAEHVELRGELGGASLAMSRVDTSHFLLLSRGFHWVNEFPLNR
jgi:hypothetical protein